MFDIIYGNLDRQARGLALLHKLLREEYELLCARRTDDVMALELSIHELLRQLAVEKQCVQRHLGGGRVMDYAAMLPDDQAADLRELWHLVDDYEQHCTRQAAYNSELSLALLDLSKDTLDFLHSRVIAPGQGVYGRAGAYLQQRPDAMLISGRL